MFRKFKGLLCKEPEVDYIEGNKKFRRVFYRFLV